MSQRVVELSATNSKEDQCDNVRKERRKCTTNGADSYWLQLAGGSVSVGECGKTGGSLSCPLVAPLSRLVGMNGYNSVILCKPTLHSGKGLQGRLSYRLARTQTSLQLRVGEHLTAEPRTRVRDVAVHPEHAAEEENLRTDAVISRRLIAGGQTG